MKLKIKKIHPNAVVPKYSYEDDAAMDVVAVDKEITDKYIEYKIGLKFEVPENYVMLIFPRSSVSNKDLLLCNSVGVLDSGYRGELVLRFQKLGENIYLLNQNLSLKILLLILLYQVHLK